MAGIRIQIDGIPNYSKLLEQITKPAQLLNDVQQIRRISFYNSIASGKDARGNAVAPLSPAYAKYKSRKWGNKPIRSASGNMISTYTSNVSGDKLTEEVTSDIAIHFQKGTSRMPKRQLLPESWDEIPSAERQLIERAVTEFLDDIVRDLVSR